MLKAPPDGVGCRRGFKTGTFGYGGTNRRRISFWWAYSGVTMASGEAAADPRAATPEKVGPIRLLSTWPLSPQHRLREAVGNPPILTFEQCTVSPLRTGNDGGRGGNQQLYSLLFCLDSSCSLLECTCIASLVPPFAPSPLFQPPEPGLHSARLIEVTGTHPNPQQFDSKGAVDVSFGQRVGTPGG